MNIVEVLNEIGYKLNNRGYYYTSSANYRGGTDPTSLTIYPDKNLVIDWVSGEKFNIERLIALTLKTSPDQIKEWLQTKNINIVRGEKEPELKELKLLSMEWLNYLTPDHTYWLNRGIKKEVLEELKGGAATDQIPRMKGRYCLPIFNENQLIGLQGRSLDGKNPKYKIIGEKSLFTYPLHIALKDIQRESEVILVEGVGCVLSCLTCNIRNVICLFGINLSNHQLSTLISLNPNKITIAVNNDGAGLEAARKISARLLKFFDKQQVVTLLPHKKDWNEVLLAEGNIKMK